MLPMSSLPLPRIAVLLRPGAHLRSSNLVFGIGRRTVSADALNAETVSYLRDGRHEREVYLVGTAHVSKRSAEDVRDVIRFVSPDCVMVELCEKRAQRLRNKDVGSQDTPEKIARRLLEQIIGRGTTPPGFGVEWLLKVGLSGFYALLRQFGVVPGLEFQVALEEADQRCLRVCLGDRDVDETIARLRTALGNVSLASIASSPPPPPELVQALGGMDLGDFSQSVERIKNRRQIASFRKYLSQTMPEVMEVMAHERDAYMAEKLLTECKPGRIVAVVGMAHMDGIEQEWQNRGGEVFLHADNSMRTTK